MSVVGALLLVLACFWQVFACWISNWRQCFAKCLQRKTLSSHDRKFSQRHSILRSRRASSVEFWNLCGPWVILGNTRSSFPLCGEHKLTSNVCIYIFPFNVQRKPAITTLDVVVSDLQGFALILWEGLNGAETFSVSVTVSVFPLRLT